MHQPVEGASLPYPTSLFALVYQRLAQVALALAAVIVLSAAGPCAERSELGRAHPSSGGGVLGVGATPAR